MTAQELIKLLQKQGGIIEVEGDSLLINAPDMVLSDDLQNELAEHKSEILTLLRRHPTEVCPQCGGPVVYEEEGEWIFLDCERGHYAGIMSKTWEYRHKPLERK